MAKFCVSVSLAPSCCKQNYLENVCRSRAREFRGRKYVFMWCSISLTAGLICNGVLVGVVWKGQLGIYSQFSSLGFTESSIKSLIALFNLYPY